MSKLLAHSKLNVDGLLTLIVRRKEAIEGYYCTFFNAGNIYQWSLSNDIKILHIQNSSSQQFTVYQNLIM